MLKRSTKESETIMTKQTTKAATSIKAAGKAKAAPEVIATPAAATKADKARVVFDAAYAQNPVPQRKDIIANAMGAAELSKPAAATYLQNYKRSKGMIAAKA